MFSIFIYILSFRWYKNRRESCVIQFFREKFAKNIELIEFAKIVKNYSAFRFMHIKIANLDTNKKYISIYVYMCFIQYKNLKNYNNIYNRYKNIKI